MFTTHRINLDQSKRSSLINSVYYYDQLKIGTLKLTRLRADALPYAIEQIKKTYQ